jgi:hypothetical protein
MYKREPHEAIGKGAPPPEVIAFIEEPIRLRMEATRRHFSQDELAQLRYVCEGDWRALDASVQALLEKGVARDGKEAKEGVRQWHALADRVAGGDAALRDKMLALALTDPILSRGSPMSRASREFLREAASRLQRKSAKRSRAPERGDAASNGT